MSPVGETLRTRCRNFPGLVNNTSIDWFTAWPRQALHAVASQFLAEVRRKLHYIKDILLNDTLTTCYNWLSLQNDKIPDEYRDRVVEHVVHVHLSVSKYSKEFQEKLRRVNHVTPKNYLDFISTYTKLLQEKDKSVQDQVKCPLLVAYYLSVLLRVHYSIYSSIQCQRLSSGLAKLIEAADQIKVMNEKLEVQQVAVKQKSEACDTLLVDISAKTLLLYMYNSLIQSSIY